ncbi:hypothetical protein GGTG_02282 [Gaeumannomyces tritici R3-111a-1]|uniref:Uncharacterized protein n=1 Tax=Gaeumannomyces tritici (strain R3-111a-1) TaxID=644352 RepID=J3NLX7_GAET3|nr:hypothetical protein GGTG_02282 [Gaeumannomyces tritici R3-111a-1]EJT82308.1 hypothetical protein GGTG_02282 [Gaeumannomyces tritici R3-111a-1]
MLPPKSLVSAENPGQGNRNSAGEKKAAPTAGSLPAAATSACNVGPPLSGRLGGISKQQEKQLLSYPCKKSNDSASTRASTSVSCCTVCTFPDLCSSYHDRRHRHICIPDDY